MLRGPQPVMSLSYPKSCYVPTRKWRTGRTVHFDPEAIAVLVAAYEAVMHDLGNPGVDVSTRNREAVAKRIIEVAGAGVRDINALRWAGLCAITTPVADPPDAPVSTWGRARAPRQLPPVRPWPRSRRWRA